eukprot:UN07186
MPPDFVFCYQFLYQIPSYIMYPHVYVSNIAIPMQVEFCYLVPVNFSNIFHNLAPHILHC